MKLVGLCGASGSGKTTVCSILQNHGVKVLDCDRIYHELVSHPGACLDELESAFGKNIIKGGALDRNALRNIVFSDSDQLKKLNAISHRHVLAELKIKIEELQKQNVQVCVIDAPMLFEAGLDRWCDLLCAVVASPSEQIARICKRDNISEDDARLRIEKQLNPKILMEKCDYIIENNGHLADLEKQCLHFIHSLKTI